MLFYTQGYISTMLTILQTPFQHILMASKIRNLTRASIAGRREHEITFARNQLRKIAPLTLGAKPRSIASGVRLFSLLNTYFLEMLLQMKGFILAFLFPPPPTYDEGEKFSSHAIELKSPSYKYF